MLVSFVAGCWRRAPVSVEGMILDFPGHRLTPYMPYARDAATFGLETRHHARCEIHGFEVIAATPEEVVAALAFHCDPERAVGVAERLLKGDSGS